MNDLVFGDDAPALHLMTTMRAMRRLKPDPVPKELIEKLLTAASYGPSAGNNQAFSYVVVTDREPIAAIAPHWRRLVDWYVATQTPPPHMTEDGWQRLVAALRHQGDHFEDIPCLIVACYEMKDMVDRMKANVDRQKQGMKVLGLRGGLAMARNSRRMMVTGEAASIYPAVQNLLLMARALGLGATMTTWHIMFEQEFKKILGIPSYVHTYATIPVGYPAGNFGPVSRRPVSEAIHWQGW